MGQALQPGVPVEGRAFSVEPAALTGGGAKRRVLSLLLPDLSMVALLVSLVYVLFLFSGYSKLFRDADSGWHIRTGERILSSGKLPRTDPYSFTRFGRPWFAWEWGSDVLMGAAHRMWGLAGVAMLYALAIAVCSWLWFRLQWQVGGDFLLACALAAPMLSTASIHWLARPHVLSWALLLAAVLGCERLAATKPNAARALILAALGTALWANLHASFFLAPVVALIYAAAHWLRPLIWDLDRGAEWEKARLFAGCAAAAATGSLVNPYGTALHVHLFRYLTDTALLDRVGEFQSFNFHAQGAFQILLATGIAMLGVVAALSQKKLAHFLLSALLIATALRAARGLPLVALVALPLAGGAITEALATARGLQPALRRAINSFLAYSRGLRTLDAGLNGALLAPLATVVLLVLLRTPSFAAKTGFPPDQFPVAASAEVAKLPAEARLLSSDKFGGYLIYRFDGQRKVYFDGRSDLYGADYMKRYGQLVQARPGWRAQIDEFQFTHALLPNEYSITAALEGAGWKKLYRDETATLLERPR